MTVSPGDNTVAFMRTKIRRLTASSGESQLSTADLDQYLQNAYFNDFPYAIKLDQMRSIYTFFTEPYRDRYPLDVNYSQAVRAPVYFEGISGSFFKDRVQFNNLWPRWPTKFQQGGGGLNGTITAISNSTNAQITSPANGLSIGAVITISGVVGMTELNGNSYTINSIVDVNNFTIDVDSTGFVPYISGGSWISISQTFSFVIQGPFLSKECVIGGVDAFGNPISIADDGNGNLNYIVQQPVVSVPSVPNNSPPVSKAAMPGMYNVNTSNPGLQQPYLIGTVDYVSGQFNFTLPPGISLGAGQLFTVWVSQYQTGRPYCLLFWNNEFTIRPIPKLIHKVEVEIYLTPIQFLESTDQPILAQWAQYLSYLSAQEILRDRQDLDGVAALEEGRLRQEALVLERQSNEEINIPNYQLFNSTQGYSYYGGWSGMGGFY